MNPGRSEGRTAVRSALAVRRALPLLLAAAVVASPGDARGDGVAVRYREGTVHALLVLKGADGSRLASGDLTQSAAGDRVTSRLVFHFRDGSLDDETTIYTERGRFRVVSYRLVQSGPAFPQPTDMSVDGETGDVTVRYSDAGGGRKVESAHLGPIADLANGIMPVLLKNVGAQAPGDLEMIVATPKPRIVRLTITRAPDETFSAGGAPRKATHFVIKAELGGLTGMLAKIAGKQPPDSQVWILKSPVPEFLKSEQPLYAGGPLWKIELADPVWPRTSGSDPVNGPAR